MQIKLALRSCRTLVMGAAVLLATLSASAPPRQDDGCVQDTTQMTVYDGCDAYFDLGVTQAPFTWHYHFDTVGGLGACAPTVFTECDCTQGTEITPVYPGEDMTATVFSPDDGAGHWYEVDFEITEREWDYPGCSQSDICPSANGAPNLGVRDVLHYDGWMVDETEC